MKKSILIVSLLVCIAAYITVTEASCLSTCFPGYQWEWVASYQTFQCVCPAKWTQGSYCIVCDDQFAWKETGPNEGACYSTHNAQSCEPYGRDNCPTGCTYHQSGGEGGLCESSDPRQPITTGWAIETPVCESCPPPLYSQNVLCS